MSKTIANATPAGFSLLHTFCVLQNAVGADGHPRRIRGDVAQLTDGRTVARWPVTWADGTQTFAYRSWSPSENVRSLLCSEQPDCLSVIADRLNNVRCFPLEAPVENEEHARFRAQFPDMARRSGLAPAPVPVPFRRFDPGKTWFPHHTLRPDGSRVHIGADVFRPMVDLHAGGDYGLNGMYTDLRMDDPDVSWSVWEKPVDVQNSAAIATRCGMIRSAYRLPPAELPRFPRPKWDPLTPVIEINTAIGRSGSMTLISIGSIKD